MRLSELVDGLPSTVTQPGVVYARLLEAIRQDMTADRAVLALYRTVGKGRWTTYCHDREEPLFGAELRLVTSAKFLEAVRKANLALFDTFEALEPTSDSMGRHAIRHAVGAQVLDLTRSFGFGDVAGVLAVDRRGDSLPFNADCGPRLTHWAKDASLLLKAINERQPKTGGHDEEHAAALKVQLDSNDGNLHSAAKVVGIPYHKAREIIDRTGNRGWLVAKRARKSPTPDSVKKLIQETRDMREVGAQLGMDYAKLNEVIRHKGTSGLRALVEDCGFTWDQVHGPGFQRGESPPN